jgi:hypothetical protein
VIAVSLPATVGTLVFVPSVFLTIRRRHRGAKPLETAPAQAI